MLWNQVSCLFIFLGNVGPVMFSDVMFSAALMLLLIYKKQRWGIAQTLSLPVSLMLQVSEDVVCTGVALRSALMWGMRRERRGGGLWAPGSIGIEYVFYVYAAEHVGAKFSQELK